MSDGVQVYDGDGYEPKPNDKAVLGYTVACLDEQGRLAHAERNAAGTWVLLMGHSGGTEFLVHEEAEVARNEVRQQWPNLQRLWIEVLRGGRVLVPPARMTRNPFTWQVENRSREHLAAMRKRRRRW